MKHAEKQSGRQIMRPPRIPAKKSLFFARNRQLQPAVAEFQAPFDSLQQPDRVIWPCSRGTNRGGLEPGHDQIEKGGIPL
jgi:hypothetical protein